MDKVTILGYDFNIVEEYPENITKNTVFVWKNGSEKYSYYKARCYFENKVYGVGIGSEPENIEYDNKIDSIRDAIYFAMQDKLEFEVLEKIV